MKCEIICAIVDDDVNCRTKRVIKRARKWLVKLFFWSMKIGANILWISRTQAQVRLIVLFRRKVDFSLLSTVKSHDFNTTVFSVSTWREVLSCVGEIAIARDEGVMESHMQRNHNRLKNRKVRKTHRTAHRSRIKNCNWKHYKWWTIESENYVKTKNKIANIWNGIIFCV